MGRRSGFGALKNRDIVFVVIAILLSIVSYFLFFKDPQKFGTSPSA